MQPFCDLPKDTGTSLLADDLKINRVGGCIEKFDAANVDSLLDREVNRALGKNFNVALDGLILIVPHVVHKLAQHNGLHDICVNVHHDLANAFACRAHEHGQAG